MSLFAHASVNRYACPIVRIWGCEDVREALQRAPSVRGAVVSTIEVADGPGGSVDCTVAPKAAKRQLINTLAPRGRTLGSPFPGASRQVHASYMDDEVPVCGTAACISASRCDGLRANHEFAYTPDDCNEHATWQTKPALCYIRALTNALHIERRVYYTTASNSYVPRGALTLLRQAA